VDIHVSTVKRRLIDQGLLGLHPSKNFLLVLKIEELEFLSCPITMNAFAKIHCNWTTEE